MSKKEVIIYIAVGLLIADTARDSGKMNVPVIGPMPTIFRSSGKPGLLAGLFGGLAPQASA